jgi:hypothetical protein
MDEDERSMKLHFFKMNQDFIHNNRQSFMCYDEPSSKTLNETFYFKKNDPFWQSKEWEKIFI